jgi:hypothetical protein
VDTGTDGQSEPYAEPPAVLERLQGVDVTTTARRRMTPKERSAPISLVPGPWWVLIVAAVLVGVVIVGPVAVLALGDHLDREVPTEPDPPLTGVETPPPSAQGV